MDIIVNNRLKYYLSILALNLFRLSGLFCIIEHSESESNVGVFWIGWWWESAQVKEERRRECSQIVNKYFDQWTPSSKPRIQDIRLELNQGS